MNFLNDRLEQVGCEKLDLAMLNFFEQFRKIFIGDQVQKSSKVYRRMSEILGITDETMLLNVIIRKMLIYFLVHLKISNFKIYILYHRITNLKFWTKSERIISKTLSLLNDLSVGYSSVRKLMKLDSIHFILANHTVCKILLLKI